MTLGGAYMNMHEFPVLRYSATENIDSSDHTRSADYTQTVFRISVMLQSEMKFSRYLGYC